MPDDNALLLSLLINSGLAQYPDKKLYNAASMLTQQERPTVPVHVADNDPAKHLILKYRPNTQALTDADPTNPDPSITVFTGSKTYQDDDLRTLASVLAHEAVHARRRDNDETEAYQQQRDTLKRLNYPANSPFMKDLYERLQQAKKSQK